MKDIKKRAKTQKKWLQYFSFRETDAKKNI
jgi:hypothetical protein